MNRECRLQSQARVSWAGARTHEAFNLRRGASGRFKPVEAVKANARVLLRSVLMRPDELSVLPALRQLRYDELGNPWAWMSELDSGRAGWGPFDLVTRDDSLNILRSGKRYAGPANCDGWIGHFAPPAHRLERIPSPIKRGHTLYVVRAEDMYGRAAPHGSGDEYVELGDVVRVHRYRYVKRELDYCAEVLSSDTAEVGTFVWLLASGLAKLREPESKARRG